MLRASGLKSYSSRLPHRSNQPSRNNHPTPTVHAPSSRVEALRPRDFSPRLRDEKSLVYFQLSGKVPIVLHSVSVNSLSMPFSNNIGGLVFSSVTQCKLK